MRRRVGVARVGVRRIAAAGLVLLALTGCERARQDMYDQPRGKAYGPDASFSDGRADRTPPAGIVARTRGDLAGSSSGRRGDAAVLQAQRADDAATQPYPVDMALLRQGRERYDIYCLPCHSPVGDGDGRVVQRGFPPPPSYHIDRLRNAPDRYLYEVIRDGFGQMRPYRDRLTPDERWAVVAYVRALQLSQHAQVDALPAAVRDEVVAKLPRKEQP
jgi:mono/diheme cytochrome c family protein